MYFFRTFFVKTALGKYFEVTAALGKYFEALPCSNFLKQMVSGSKLKCPSKSVLGEASFSLYYSVICGNCLGNVLVGTKNVEKCAGHSFLYTTYIDSNICHGISLKKTFWQREDSYLRRRYQKSTENAML